MQRQWGTSRRLRVTAARIGVVLAGGRATRMHGEKAGALLGGQTLLARAVATVQEAGLQPRVCARAETLLPQVDGLRDGDIWREPALPGPAHPLAGIAHALRAAREPILTLPVDLPLLPPRILRALANQPGPLAVIGTGGRPSALVAVADPAFAEHLTAAAAAGAPALRTLVELGAAVVDLADLTPEALRGSELANVNDAAGLLAAERLLTES